MKKYVRKYNLNMIFHTSAQYVNSLTAVINI